MAFNLGDIFVTFKAKTESMDSAFRSVKDGMEKLDKGAQGMEKNLKKAGVVAGAVAGVVQNVFNRAVNMVTNSISAAIKRVDTLKNSRRTFQNMGFDAATSSKAIDQLEKSIKGLPTPLDSAMRGMTALAATYGDVEFGQKVFTSLNNAILGFGGTAAQVDNAITQISQLPLDGPLDAQTWNSLRNSGLTPVLVAMSKEFGMSMSEMKDALGSGELKVEDFMNKLVEMNTKGGGGLKSLSKIAKDSTSGIATGWDNLQTAIVRGVATIIEAIGSENISAAISAIGTAFEFLLKGVAAVFGFIKENRDIFAPIAAGIMVIVTALLIWNMVNKIIAVSQAVFNAVLAANPITLIIMAVIGLVAALIWFFTQTELGRNILKQFFKTASDTFKGIVGFVNDAKRNIGNFVTNVINWFKNLPKNIGNALARIGDFITRPFRNAFNFISDAWNNTVGRLSWKVPDWVPYIGGNTIGAPKLQRFYTGVENFKGGLAYVHQGEILANLPKGTDVIRKDKVNEMMGGGGLTVYGDINIADRQDADYLLKRIDRNMKLERMGLSPA